MNFQLPPVVKNKNGNIRKVGFELEYAGINIKEALSIIIELFGGRIEEESAFKSKIKNTVFGDFTVEIDAAVLKNKTYETYLEKIGIDIKQFSYQNLFEELLIKLAETAVPYEIVTPPIPLTKLDLLEDLRKALQVHKALGTKSSFIYAFGLHINPEVPDTSADTLLKYLRSFLLLQRWIANKSGVDFSRKITPFIDDFPDLYYILILDSNYSPTIDELIDDYLTHNPTRNRALDMLPLLAYIDEEKVLSVVEEKDLIKPRPTFHYRLPNCMIDEPRWTIAGEWNYWVEVEKLAGSPEKLKKMCADLLYTMHSTGLVFKYIWTDKVEDWIRK